MFECPYKTILAQKGAERPTICQQKQRHTESEQQHIDNGTLLTD